MKSRQLPCELCGRKVNIRATIKHGEHKGKKTCPVCKEKSEPKTGTSGPPLRQSTQKTLAKQKARSIRRTVYFDHHIKLCTRSEESNTYIRVASRANICHLFAKGLHPSLEADLRNVVYLTIDEHTKFDNLLFAKDFPALEKAFKNCWSKVCDRFAALLPDCKDKTVFRAKMLEYLIGKGYSFPDSL